jgi:septal ring factor EnvC (AmiA/AmiB activator)
VAGLIALGLARESLAATATPAPPAKTATVPAKKKAPDRKAVKPGTRPSTTKALPVKAPQAPQAARAANSPRRPQKEEASPLDPEQAQALREQNAAQLDQLHARLDELRREISAGEATKSEAADALSSSEAAISDANRKLRDLSQQQSDAQTQLTQINSQRAGTVATIGSQQEALSRMLREQYLHGADDPYKLLFSGDNPNRIARDFEYLGYISRAQAELLTELHLSVAQMEDLSHQAAQRTQQLDAINTEQVAQRAELLKDQETRRATLAAISQKLASQRAEAGNLERDDARLSRVVDELSKLIERQAKDRADRAERARIAQQKMRDAARLEEQRRAQAAQDNALQPPKPEHAPPEEKPAVVAESHGSSSAGPQASPQGSQAASHDEVALADFDGHFPRLKGALKLPVKGELLAHFGSARAGGGPTWKGIFIEAPEGSDVHAVAPGRVVFAEWLRGFGNLLIIDHGDQYLSIYGNNESLLKQPGDVVQAGELVATAGNSGGNPETGLYFELRYQGKPFDPLTWTGGR